ncbi:carboxylesterase family protein [Flavobacterium sp. Sd200]|uniref:carboxylesterase/lipase family protein n=1 Tax=Flavobacterium sp. Sd200 TaxID=2692211 RepID=UPI00136DC386|nr:carboxylesterase family protein [Flavobacterium sp. Sd200]MXN89979.1 carboxylesterase family protein [Flavobacterium sp. Sd200]
MTKKYLLLAVLFQFTMALTAQKAPQAKVAQGTLEGKTLPSGVQSYLGIPYAQPPVNELRWVAPQPPKGWKGVRKATVFGNYPMQKNVFGDMIFRAPKMSEDCLYLNVWTPAKKPTEKLPVLVYFYGGGFVAGDGSENRYDGESLATRGIVTVTLNYRLGIFGFFSHPELTKESPNQSSGNYGLLDQNAALLWVKKNIAAFGGDPDRITIAGESAGSISVSAHMVSPLSKNLIAGAIGQSGAMINPTYEAILLSDGEAVGDRVFAKSGITSIAEMRKVTAEKLLEIGSDPFIDFKPRAVVDGYFLPNLPSAIFAVGEQAKVPLLVGWTSAEMPYTAFMQGQFPSPENYKKVVKERFGDKSDELLSLYPGNTVGEVVASATALASDTFIVYSTWKWADDHRKYAPVFAYNFSKPRPPMKPEWKDSKVGLAGGITKDANKKDGEKKDAKKEDKKMPDALVGAAHASDIEYVLGNLMTNPVYAWTPEDIKVSENAQTYFSNFIKTGNPNEKGLPDWPVSIPGNDLLLMDINTELKLLKNHYTKRYIFLENYYNSKK